MNDYLNKYAPTVLRVGVSLVFLWFGSQQLMDPQSWAMWVPSYVRILPVSIMTVVVLNGLFELVVGGLLLAGLFTRISAALLTLHSLHLLFVVGYSAIGVRDFAIFVATLTVFLNGVDKFTLDNFLSKKEKSVNL